MSKCVRVFSSLSLVTALGVACDPAHPSGEADDSATEARQRASVDPQVWSSARDILARDGAVRLLVRVGGDSVPAMRRVKKTARARLMNDRQLSIRMAVDRISAALPAGAQTVQSYEQMPLAALADLGGADAWYLDEPHERFLDDSLPLISQPQAEAEGFTGAGTAVAVLDTGLDYSHADFGSCTSVGTPASCRVVANKEIAPDDGALDDNGHGTNVAAIVGGVAPGTDLIGMDVFRADGYAYTSDIISAIDWVVRLDSGLPTTDWWTSGISAICSDGAGGAFAAAIVSLEVVSGSMPKDVYVLHMTSSGAVDWHLMGGASAPSAPQPAAVAAECHAHGAPTRY